MLAGIREILIISTQEDTPSYERLLGDGSQYGITLQYKIQLHPRGLADAFIIGKDFIADDKVCLILGDNLFHGHELTKILNKASAIEKGAMIFGYPVKDARPYGVVEFDQNYKVLSIEEKPVHPKSNYAVPGLYFYDNRVVDIAHNIVPSARGELEITALNNEYLANNELQVILLSRGMAWFDTGSPTSLLKASEYVEAIQTRQGLYIACLEEIAWRRGFIDDQKLKAIGEDLQITEYGEYILSLLND